MNYNGYIIYRPTSGGKAGKGRNETTSFQIRPKDGSRVIKNIVYKVGDRKSHDNAFQKAKDFIDILVKGIADFKNRI